MGAGCVGERVQEDRANTASAAMLQLLAGRDLALEHQQRERHRRDALRAEPAHERLASRVSAVPVERDPDRDRPRQQERRRRRRDRRPAVC